MADNVNVPDSFAENLEGQIAGLNEMLTDPETGLENKIKELSQKIGGKDEAQWSITKALLKETFALNGSYERELEELQKTGKELRNSAVVAAKLASEQPVEASEINALSATQRFKSYADNFDINDVVSKWFNAIKNKQEFDLGSWLIPPNAKLIGDRYVNEFRSSNWQQISHYLYIEAGNYERVCWETKEAIGVLMSQSLNVGFSSTQPDKQLLDELEQKQINFKWQKLQQEQRLSHYRKLLEENRRHFAEISEGRWTPEEIERAAQAMTQEDLAKEEKKQQEEMSQAAANVKVNLPSQKEKISEEETKKAAVKKPSEATLIREGMLAEEAAANGETWGVYRYLRDPGGGFGRAMSFFRGIVGRAFSRGESSSDKGVVQEVAEKKATSEVKKATSTGAKKLAGTAAKKLTPGIVAKLSGFIPTGVTQAIAIASVVKDILSGIKGVFTNPQIRDTLLGLGTGAMLLLKMLVDFVFSSVWTAGGAALGGFVGFAFGGSIGAFFGASAGAWLGSVVGPSISASISSFLAGGSAAGAAPAIAGGSAVGIGSAFGASAATGAAAFSIAGISAAVLGGAAPVLIAVGVVTVGTLVTFVTTSAAFVAPPQEEIESQGPDPIVAVVKSVDEVSLPNNSGKSLNYSLVITAGGSDIKVSVTDETTVNGKVVPSPTPTTAYPTAITKEMIKEVKFAPFSVASYNDSTIVDTITVVATSADGKNSETRKAVAVTTIGTSKNDQPYGYPASGGIYSLDTEFWKATGQHRGTFFTGSGGRYWEPGGMDILDRNGNVPVYSTVKGTVIYSKFDLGDSKMVGKCRNISTVLVGSIFSDCAVSGAVIIQAGNFTVSYLHLNSSLAVSTGSQVDRGTRLGTTYAGASGGIPTVNGWHTHYQILFNGIPYYFSEAPLGKCSQGAVLPSLPKFGDIVKATTSPTCE